ncbi:hypothetical protein Ade02nite_50620 [Paractinoplanes deccanensis]|uniref:Uncharacterized protein n=1 Tax=Paractinoplanes deccanensis TaxID=113561 RepID=A0ABQ3Y8U5_9ACTN|nr:hypothetical protein Ade02nite_50620 [Actinoplanes deccanensis]
MGPRRGLDHFPTLGKSAGTEPLADGSDAPVPAGEGAAVGASGVVKTVAGVSRRCDKDGRSRAGKR